MVIKLEKILCKINSYQKEFNLILILDNLIKLLAKLKI
jgi:hypothetical protein